MKHINKKNMKKTNLLIVFILIANNCFSQTPYDERILVNNGSIDFLIKTPNRYAHNILKIKLVHGIRDTTITAHVVSIPRENCPPEWEKSRIDTVYNLKKQDFDSIVDMILRIRPDYIRKRTSKFVDFDGNETSVQLENPNYYVKHGLSNPSIKYEPNYMNSFMMVLELVGLDPKYIFRLK